VRRVALLWGGSGRQAQAVARGLGSDNGCLSLRLSGRGFVVHGYSDASREGLCARRGRHAQAVVHSAACPPVMFARGRDSTRVLRSSGGEN
jgi:hypothetical protein